MKIFVVDDEEDLCEILRFNLEAEGFEVETAHSAEEALAMLRAPHSTPCDLLLLDVMMERMSGFEMAETLRQGGDNTPIIFLTARDAHDDQLQGFGVGGDDYIVKPFSFDTVLARIKAVLRRSGGAGSSRMAGMTSMAGMAGMAGMASMASSSSMTSRSSMASMTSISCIGLTKREHLILRLLQENPGRFFSRAEILEAVWPDDTCVGERSVDVHIARLRKKLGDDGGRIVNKTGFGYGLV